jgi:hypothetical protein
MHQCTPNRLLSLGLARHKGKLAIKAFTADRHKLVHTFAVDLQNPVALAPWGNEYVVVSAIGDAEHCLCVYRLKDGLCALRIGSIGDGHGQFNQPWGICVSKSDLVFRSRL